jgi:hypothetical protein
MDSIGLGSNIYWMKLYPLQENVQSIYVMGFDSDSYRGSFSSRDLRFLSTLINQMYPTVRVTTVKGRATSSHLTIAILENDPVLLFWF